jgi:hypothetical protein
MSPPLSAALPASTVRSLPIVTQLRVGDLYAGGSDRSLTIGRDGRLLRESLCTREASLAARRPAVTCEAGRPVAAALVDIVDGQDCSVRSPDVLVGFIWAPSW